jgi:hypothetical protein
VQQDLFTVPQLFIIFSGTGTHPDADGNSAALLMTCCRRCPATPDGLDTAGPSGWITLRVAEPRRDHEL